MTELVNQPSGKPIRKVFWGACWAAGVALVAFGIHQVWPQSGIGENVEIVSVVSAFLPILVTYITRNRKSDA